MGIQEEKKQVRAQMRQVLARMSADERLQASRAIVEKLRSLEAWGAAPVVLAFLPLPTEVDLRSLLDIALAEGKIVALPRCQPDNDLSFHTIHSGYQTDLCKGPYSLQEPPQDWPSIDPATLPFGSLVLVPALAFTKEGVRLGKGKGYYDRFLTRIAPETFSIGVCFNQQLVDHLPTSGQDMPVRLVVTQR
jgi:5-formyltetrahydrofolate cyclo-ligase